MAAEHTVTPGLFWMAFGTAGAVIFYGRFYVQWLASEIQKRSVIPIAFWYMSSVGSIMIFIYSVVIRSPGAAFGQCFNIVVYARNLVHIWREKGRLTAALNFVTHAAAGTIVAVAAGFMAWTWIKEYHVNQSIEPAQAARNWFWLGVWGVGQTFFFSRFLVQWIVTEFKRKSTVPAAFWHLSLAAALLQSSAFAQRGDWVNCFGMVATILIYVRNLWFIYRHPEAAASAGE